MRLQDLLGSKTILQLLFLRYLIHLSAIVKNFLGENVCVDEMLVPFRGWCMFEVYMPKKPVKYGLKVQTSNGAKTGYFYNAYQYCGKGTDSSGLSNEVKKFTIPSQTVRSLVSPIITTNRKMTVDN